MAEKRSWQEELKIVVDLMRDLSLQDDPQAAAIMYAERLRSSGLLVSDARLSISRRNLTAPNYRITRSSRWTENIDPWMQPDRLPQFSTGLLGELIYSNEPEIIWNLPERLKEDDPAIEYLHGYQLLAASPQYDGGESLNMTIILIKDRATFQVERMPTMVWMSNLWGRGVYNLVLRKELQKSHEKLRVANTELDHELKTVGRIQRSLLPTRLPKVPGLDLAAHYQTSERAGGDYYDLFDCGEGRWGILIADVSGHGAPAAVIMAITHAIAHLHPGGGTPPGELMKFVNDGLASKYTNGNGSFVTAFYGLYDSKTRRLIYARAGHNSPRLLRDGIIQSLDGDGGLPLGLFEDSEYGEGVETLKPGDSLMLYTDGIIEARDPAGEMYGVERLDEALIAGGRNATTAMTRVLETLEEFTGGAALLDDRTLLALAVR
jgi:sigma-B regulation protein RsbU (phosphoserine phosphatase)